MQVTQKNVNALSSGVKDEMKPYVKGIEDGAIQLASTFNDIWISELSKQRRDEIEKVVNTQIANLFKVMNSINSRVAMAVSTFNATENERINYDQFSWPTPTFKVYLNANLPDGSLGFLEGADMLRVSQDLEDIRNSIYSTINKLIAVVSQCGAFGPEDMKILSNSFNEISNTLNKVMLDMKKSVDEAINEDKKRKDEAEQVVDETLNAKAVVEEQ